MHLKTLRHRRISTDLAVKLLQLFAVGYRLNKRAISSGWLSGLVKISLYLLEMALTMSL
jgi:hypothetical protein